MSHSFESLPDDIVLEIASRLSRGDAFDLALTSSRLFAVVSAVVYAAVALNSLEQCQTTLRMLYRRSDISRHVRELVIRPKTKKPDVNAYQSSLLASALVRDVVSARRFEALTTFAWDHEELPHHDDMWFALRICCPQLKYLSSTLGALLPFPTSHLFDFSNLEGISVFLKPGFYENHGDMFLDEEQPVAERFWDMVIRRCPNLQDFTLEGLSILPVDASQLLAARWPSLKRLALGDLVMDRNPRPGQKSPFIDFLEAHPTLKSIGLSRRNIDPSAFQAFAPGTLKFLSFSGTLQQLQALPQIHGNLRSLTFREAMYTRDTSPLAVASVLHNLPSLTKLKISFMLHSMYDSGNLLRSLIAACPNLRHFELTCGLRPSFQLESFARAIRSLTKLRVLHLTIVKYPGDESLSAGAARIATANPRLEKFSLTFLPPSYPLPFAIPFVPFPLRSRDSGSFTLTCDKHGLPVTLRALERRRLFWPLGLGQSSRTRRYESDLRPSAALHSKSGMFGLITERSAAGEEMRMIVLCSFLLCLSMWGLVLGSDSRLFTFHTRVD